MTGAWKLSLAAGPKFVLLSLCDNANDQGQCFPSISMIAQRCSMGERTVQAHIQTLVDAGLLRRIERTGRSTIYQLDAQKITSPRTVEEHYVYRISDIVSGEFYIGVRSSVGPADSDAYMGSGAWFNERVSNGGALKKVILSRHQSRQDAENEERRLIAIAAADPLCRNKRTPADFAPRKSCAPQISHPTPAKSAPPPPQISHPTPADFAPITVKEPSIEPSRKQGARSAPKRPDDVPEQVWADWLALRKQKRASVTETVLSEARSEAGKAGISLERFLRIWCARGSQGLQADWLKPHERGSPAVWDEARAKTIAALRGENRAPAKPAQEVFDVIAHRVD